jgi:hypothetical protein
MSETPRRLIEIGTLPRAGEIFVDGADPIAIMLREADAKLASERAAKAKAAASRVADEERTKAMRRARISRRFLKVWKAFARG